MLVIDANFPAGAKLIISKIRALTEKPIRFAFDTHHHGDHAYGNQVFVENGGVPVAHTGVIEEMKRYETGSDRGAGSDDGFPSQVAKVYEELTGNKLAALVNQPHVARHAHARSHGLA